MADRDAPATEPFGDRLDGLRVGVDMDGVLADFNAAWMERYNQHFGTALDPTMVRRWDGLHRLTSFATMPEFWLWARGEGRSVFRDAPPLPGAVESARRIASQHRLIVVSSKFDWAIPDSLAWLGEHDIPAREVHFLWDKTQIPCDVYLDDAPHQLRELRDTLPSAQVCRMVQAWNDPIPGVIDVRSWQEFEAVVGDVMRMRGLAPSA